MKNCRSFEKQLTAYLDGELSAAAVQPLESHLKGCAACRRELDALRAAQVLLGDALDAAPCPRELAPWDLIPKKRFQFPDFCYQPRFRAMLTSAAVFGLFFFFSLNVVVFQSLRKQERRNEAARISFELPEADPARPKMELRKVRMPAEPSAAESVPELNRPVVARRDTEIPALEMPEIPGARARIFDAGELVDDFADPAAVPSTRSYAYAAEHRFLPSIRNPLSSFPAEVDCAAYGRIRNYLAGNRLPPPDEVRIEQMVNYFNYDYPAPAPDGDPFVVSMEVARCPWNTDHQLALIGLQGLELETRNLPPNNLVFLIDISGSMNRPDKLPLLKSAMRLLTDQLRPRDRVSIVAYAGPAGLVLEPTADKALIRAAIDRIDSGGTSDDGEGIALAYKTAAASFMKEGNNRVIFATDGDFNLGATSDAALLRLIGEQRNAGIRLSVLGFGSDNYNDSKMKRLAARGEGNYAHIEDILEAKKVLVNEIGGSLVSIASDVGIEVEFNPREIQAYRLIGFENPPAADRRPGGGELAAGHRVTALYELVPAGSREALPMAGNLKYQKTRLVRSDELMTVRLHYRKPDGGSRRLIVKSVRRGEFQDLEKAVNIGFASAVAEFGLLLRDSEYKGSASYRDVLMRARRTRGPDAAGTRSEFIRLVEKAQQLDRENR